MKSKLKGLGLGAALLLSLTAMTAGTALAGNAIDSPGKADADTTQLNYTGQGTGGGVISDQECGDKADPGSGGFQNGATADNYILWIYNQGGSSNGDDVLHVNGDTYDASGGHQIVTPGYDVSTMTAYVTFTVNDPGNGSWVLTISHGCFSGEQNPLPPGGSIQGPCADPAYYAIFDNTTGTGTAIKFRFSWYNTNGYNVVTKVVPDGQMYTTFQHWAKPGTVLKLGYKDPNTGTWINLQKLTAANGSYPACDVTPGFSGQPV